MFPLPPVERARVSTARLRSPVLPPPRCNADIAAAQVEIADIGVAQVDAARVGARVEAAQVARGPRLPLARLKPPMTLPRSRNGNPAMITAPPGV